MDNYNNARRVGSRGVQFGGGTSTGFVVAGVIVVVGAASWLLLVRSAEPIAWSAIEPKKSTAIAS